MSLLYLSFDNSLSNLPYPPTNNGAQETVDPLTGIKIKHPAAHAHHVGTFFYDVSEANSNAFTKQKTLTQFSIRPGRLLLSHYSVSFAPNQLINWGSQNENEQLEIIDDINFIPNKTMEVYSKNYGDLYVHLPWIENDIASTDHFGGLVLPVDTTKSFYSASPMLELRTDTERIPKVFDMTVSYVNPPRLSINPKPFIGKLNLYFSYVD